MPRAPSRSDRLLPFLVGLLIAAPALPLGASLSAPLAPTLVSGSAPPIPAGRLTDAAAPPSERGSGPGPLDLPFQPSGLSARPMTVSANVNPTSSYASEPAPMGIGDFGITPSSTAYTYSTSRFLATASIRALAASANGGYGGSYVSLQLNVVLVMNLGAVNADYWIQDVALLDSGTGNNAVYFEDNVWNFSARHVTMHSSSIQGNGTVYSGTYYADGAGAGYPGSGATLGSPANLSLEVVASTIQGLTYVGFQYNDGFGWVTYDNVTFPWTKGFQSRGFQVNGSAYNPGGFFSDAEWVLGGPGSGSNAAVSTSNLSLVLEEFNGQNFEAVPSAWDMGGDTGETASGVAAALPTTGDGLPGVHLTAASGSVTSLYGRANVAVLNLSIPQAPLVAGYWLAWRAALLSSTGRSFNFSLLPGSYLLDFRNYTIVASDVNLTLKGGQYDGLPLYFLSPAPTEALPGAFVQLNATNLPGGSVGVAAWASNRTTICGASVASSGAFSCRFRVPSIAGGSDQLLIYDNTTLAVTGFAMLAVLTDLSVRLTTTASPIDAGLALGLGARIAGGIPPYGTLRWSFGDGGANTTVSNQTTHVYAAAGSFFLSVTATDRVGNEATATASLTVTADPSLGPIGWTRPVADLGQNVTFSATLSGGSGGVRYVWSGLPAGCAPSGATERCGPFSSTGSYLLSVTATDSDGLSATSPRLFFQVFDGPSVGAVNASRTAADVGQSVQFNASISAGAGGDIFTWLGTPSVCLGSTPSLSCLFPSAGLFDVSLELTDAAGVTVVSSPLPIAISADPSLTPLLASRPSSDVGQTVNFTVAMVGGSGGASFTWGGLPTGCLTADLGTLACVPTGAGPFVVDVSGTDSNGLSATSQLNYYVSNAPTIGPIVATPASADLGRPVELAVSVEGGAGEFTYNWTGLPTGCLVRGSVANCTPTVAADFTILVTATDVNGDPVTSAPYTLAVRDAPSVDRIAIDPASPLEGEPLTLTAQLSGGSTPYVYVWSGLPEGCAATDAATIRCTPSAVASYHVTLKVTDAAGQHANGSTSFSVGAQLLGLPLFEAVLLLAALAAVAAVAAVLLIRRRRRAATPPVARRSP